MNESSSTEIRETFVPIARVGGDVTFRDAGAMAVVAAGSASMDNAGSGIFIAGGDVTMRDAGAGNMLVGGNAELAHASVGGMLAARASVSGSRIGVLVAAGADLEDSKVVLGTAQAIAFGAAAGATLYMLGRLIRRR
jgi:hypothetical protein